RARHLYPADQLPDRSARDGAVADHADALSRGRVDRRARGGTGRRVGTARVAAQGPRAGGGVTASASDPFSPRPADARAALLRRRIACTTSGIISETKISRAMWCVPT